jgi:hypothetical protein
MTVSRALTAKSTSISSTETDTFTIRRYHEILVMNYIKTCYTVHCSYANYCNIVVQNLANKFYV